MKVKYIIIILVSVLSACSVSSGVIPIGKGAYFIEKSAPQVSFGPPVGQKADIYKEANEFCANKEKVVDTVDLKEVNQVFGRHGSASLTFRCVAP